MLLFGLSLTRNYKQLLEIAPIRRTVADILIMMFIVLIRDQYLILRSRNVLLHISFVRKNLPSPFLLLGEYIYSLQTGTINARTGLVLNRLSSDIVILTAEQFKCLIPLMVDPNNQQHRSLNGRVSKNQRYNMYKGQPGTNGHYMAVCSGSNN